MVLPFKKTLFYRTFAWKNLFFTGSVFKKILATFRIGALKGLKLLLINDYITLHGYNFTQAKQRIKSTHTNVFVSVGISSFLKRSL